MTDPPPEGNGNPPLGQFFGIRGAQYSGGKVHITDWGDDEDLERLLTSAKRAAAFNAKKGTGTKVEIIAQDDSVVWPEK